MKYYVYCESDYEVYRDDFDPEEYSGFNHDGSTNHRFTVSNKQDNNQSLLKTFEADIDNPHFVVIIYSDGGTFGRTDGLVQILPPVNEQDAILIKETIEKLGADKTGFVEYSTRERRSSGVLELLSKYGYDVKYFSLDFGSYFGILEDVVILR